MGTFWEQIKKIFVPLYKRIKSYCYGSKFLY